MQTQTPQSPTSAEPPLKANPSSPAVAAPQSPAVASPQSPAVAAPRYPAVAAPQSPAVAAPRYPAVAAPRFPAVAAPQFPAVAAPRFPAVAALSVWQSREWICAMSSIDTSFPIVIFFAHTLESYCLSSLTSTISTSWYTLLAGGNRKNNQSGLNRRGNLFCTNLLLVLHRFFLLRTESPYTSYPY